MKVLVIPEEREFDPGTLTAATEGFVDVMMNLFIKKSPQQEFASDLGKNSWIERYDTINKRLETDLAATFEDPQWIQKVIAGKTGLIRVASLKGANIDGKEITSPSKLLQIARDMARVIDDIVRREEPFTKLRQNLVEQIAKSSNPNQLAAQLWEKYGDRLKETAGERYLQGSKRAYPCLQHDTKADGEWPVAFKTKGHEGFNTYSYIESTGHFEAPNEKNAEDFVTAIRGMMALVIHVDKQYRDNLLTYWEDGNCDYDTLDHADEIYDRIYYNQHIEEIHSFLYDVRSIFAKMVIGLYVAMYDRHIKTVE